MQVRKQIRKPNINFSMVTRAHRVETPGPGIRRAWGRIKVSPARLRLSTLLNRRPRKNPNVAIVVSSAVTGGAAAFLMYFFDPDRGRSRRIKTRSHLLGVGRRTSRKAVNNATRIARYNAGRLQGAGHTILSAVPNGHHRAQVDDATVNDKVRSEVLGKKRFAAMGVHVDSHRGVVHLRGEVSSESDIEDLTSAVNHVGGVVGVESFLHVPGEIAPNKAAAFAAEASTRGPFANVRR